MTTANPSKGPWTEARWSEYYAQRRTEFWTPEMVALARANRKYRQLWKACTPEQQFDLENSVCKARMHGMPESEIELLIIRVTNNLRPWRMCKSELLRALSRGR